MAKRSISLIRHFEQAMRSITWDHVKRDNVHAGRPYILVYCSIANLLRGYERRIHTSEHLLPLIRTTAKKASKLEVTAPKSESYFKNCALLSIFINAYIDMRESADDAFKTVRLIGETEHCNVMATILDGEQIG